MNNNTYLTYINEIKDFEPLTFEEEMDLRSKIINGCEKSKNELYNRHLKFVVHEAKKYYSLNINFIELGDLINEGNIGLWVAIEKFKFDKDNRFMTYAVFHIKHQILNLLKRDQQSIRLPLNKDSDTLPKCYSLSSFYEPNDDDGTMELMIGDIDSNTLEHELDLSIIYDLVEELNNNEKLIILNYFGIKKEKSLNLEEIGVLMSLSKERVRQIKDNALRKLRSKSYKLSDLLSKMNN